MGQLVMLFRSSTDLAAISDYIQHIKWADIGLADQSEMVFKENKEFQKLCNQSHSSNTRWFSANQRCVSSIYIWLYFYPNLPITKYQLFTCAFSSQLSQSYIQTKIMMPQLQSQHSHTPTRSLPSKGRTW